MKFWYSFYILFYVYRHIDRYYTQSYQYLSIVLPALFKNYFVKSKIVKRSYVYSFVVTSTVCTFMNLLQCYRISQICFRCFSHTDLSYLNFKGLTEQVCFFSALLHIKIWVLYEKVHRKGRYGSDPKLFALTIAPISLKYLSFLDLLYYSAFSIIYIYSKCCKYLIYKPNNFWDFEHL